MLLSLSCSDQGTSWNAQGSQSRTVSQSSAGDANSDNAGWSSNNSAPSSAGISRSSPPNSINQQSNHPLGDNGWGGHNGNPDMRKLTRWDSTPGSTRMTDTGTANGYCIQSVGHAALTLPASVGSHVKDIVFLRKEWLSQLRRDTSSKHSSSRRN